MFLLLSRIQTGGFIPVLPGVCLLRGLWFLWLVFSQPEAKAVHHPLKDAAAPPDQTGAEVSTKQGWPLSRGRLGTPSDENAIKTNSPADRGPSPVSLLITCSKTWDLLPSHLSARLEEGHDCKTIESPKVSPPLIPTLFWKGKSLKSNPQGQKDSHTFLQGLECRENNSPGES